MRRILICLYFVLFVGLGVTGWSLLQDTRDEYRRLVKMEADNRQRLAQAQARLKTEEQILERLRSDRVYVERVIRRKLGYSKPDEAIFRFPDPNE